MSLSHSPGIVSNGLILSLDAGNPKSFPATSKVEVFMWGGGGAGGTPGGWSYGAPGGAGGAAYGLLTVSTSTAYTIVVGGGGQVNSTTRATGGGGIASVNLADNRYGSGGGGYSGIFSGSPAQGTALLMAGGGGGGGSSRAGTGNSGGAGGGAMGQYGWSPYDNTLAYRGRAGTNVAAGADATSSGPNTAGNQAAMQGGNARTNCYGGAGGGGYWGGSGGGYLEPNTMAGGGGGSGYYNPTYVTVGYLQGGIDATAGYSANALRGTAGAAGAASAAGTAGVVIVRYLGGVQGTGGTITSSGGYTIHTFTSGGTFTYGIPWKELSGANHGLLTNGPAYNAANGGVMAFDGVDDVAVFGSLGAMPPTGTISFWMYPTVVVNYNNPFATHYTSGNVGMRFEMSTGGVFGCVIGNDAGTYGSGTFTASLQPNVWKHVVLVWNTVTNFATGYLDGVQVFNVSHTYWATTIGNLGIGMGFATRFYQGRIGAASVYNRNLSAAEVLQNFNALRGRYGL